MSSRVDIQPASDAVPIPIFFDPRRLSTPSARRHSYLPAIIAIKIIWGDDPYKIFPSDITNKDLRPAITYSHFFGVVSRDSLTPSVECYPAAREQAETVVIMKSKIAFLMFLCLATTEGAAQESFQFANEIVGVHTVWTHDGTEYELKEGDRLRIRIPGSRKEYILKSIRADTMVVSRTKGKFLSPRRNRTEMYRIAFGDVEKVELRVPRTTGWGMLQGAAYGCGLGGLIGGVYFVDKWMKSREEDTDQLEGAVKDILSPFTLIGYMVVGGLIGIPFGAVFGAIYPGKHWQRVELTKGISMSFYADRALSVHYARDF